MTSPLSNPDVLPGTLLSRHVDSGEIPLSRPDISEDDIQAVVDVLRTPFLSLGPRLGAFESEFAAFTGLRFATAASSGTAALHMAVRAMELGPGDEVITSPFSFVASVNCILFERATPVFVDIDRKTFNLDAAQIEQHVTPRTRAILPVHVFGRPTDMDAVLAIARRHDLLVIEDSCEALGARWRGAQVGTLGKAGAFAFYPNKQMTTGEGGMVVTNDPALDRVFKSLRNQGRGSSGEWLQHERLGFNYRLSDINCALGSSQLRRVSQMLERRRQVADIYGTHLANVEGIELPTGAVERGQVSWFVYVVRLTNLGRSGRDAVLASLRSAGIACSDYFSPLHLQPHLRCLGYGEGSLPTTEAVSASTVALPFYNALQDDQIARIADALARAIDAAHGAYAAHSLHRSVL